jgi:hypothetical protein
MRNHKALSTIAALTIVGSSLAIGLCLNGGAGPHLEPSGYRELGRVFARETLSLLRPGGAIMVITRDTAAFPNPASDILFASFKREVSKAGAKIDSVQALQLDPLRPVSVPPGDFFRWIKNSDQGSVIVSFLGPPLLSDAQLSQLGQVKPAIVALCSGAVRDQADLRSLFSEHLLRAAVISKRPATAFGSPPASEQESFDRLYALISTSNLSTLPPNLTNPSPPGEP